MKWWLRKLFVTPLQTDETESKKVLKFTLETSTEKIRLNQKVLSAEVPASTQMPFDAFMLRRTVKNAVAKVTCRADNNTNCNQ